MAREYPDISSFSLHKILDRSEDDMTKQGSILQAIALFVGFAVFWAVCYKGVEMLFPSINSPGFIAFIISIIVSWLVGKTITLFILPLVGLAALLYSGYKVLNR